MNKVSLLALSMGVMMVGTELEARSFEVAVWRGETMAARVPDFAELGPAPEGIGVKVGNRQLVKDAVIRRLRALVADHALDRLT